MTEITVKILNEWLSEKYIIQLRINDMYYYDAK